MKKTRSRTAYGLLHPKGHLHMFYEDTGRLAIYASRRRAEEANEKYAGKFKIVEIWIDHPES